MALAFTAGQTGAGVDGCLSGALNCVRAEEGAELVTVSAYKCGGGHVEGTPEELTRGLFQLMTKIETFKLFEIQDINMGKGQKRGYLVANCVKYVLAASKVHFRLCESSILKHLHHI